MALPTPKPEIHATYKLRASAPAGTIPASSSVLRVARHVIGADRRAATLSVARQSPQQLAFDFYRNGR
jgi:hypothetical protein